MTGRDGRLHDQLAGILGDMAPLAVAVSGGIDSLTLMSAAHRRLGRRGVMAIHAVSPAVPGEATARVEAEAGRQGWALRIVTAGEFSDPRYLANPVNRCFFCKTNLYAALGEVTDRQLASGANTDDLGEYRPGLDAARDHRVRHPYVETGLAKRDVRALARALGLGALAELPASPCLSSRVETGIAIDSATLRFIGEAERLLAERLPQTATLRCRVRAGGIAIEIDAASLAALDDAERAGLANAICASTPPALASVPLRFAPYRTGSAFLTATHAPLPTGTAR